MQQPISSSQSAREPIPSFSVDPLLFPQFSAPTGSQFMPSAPIEYQESNHYPTHESSNFVNPQVWLATPSGPSGTNRGTPIGPANSNPDGNISVGLLARTWYNFPAPINIPWLDHLNVNPNSNPIPFNDGTDRQPPKVRKKKCTKSHDAPSFFQCRWEGCHSSTRFNRKSDLIRHLNTIHISSDAHPCLEANCESVFGRKDHLNEHQRRRHAPVQP